MSSEWKSENWIAASWDKLQSGRHILLGIEQWIFRQRSEFQEVAIAAVPDYGRGLFLDAVLELVELDEFVYHESLALPPLLHHPRPRRVLIQGGGDGCALREVLRDPRVEEVVLVELDGLVIDACREHLGALHQGSFDDPRVRILVQDVFPYLESEPEPFDIVLVDLLDGYDTESVALYHRVLEATRRVLAPGGIVGGYGDLAPPAVPARYVVQGLRSAFTHTAMHRASIESFGGAYGFVLASDDIDFRSTPRERLLERAASLSGPLRALTPEAFPGCFQVPPYLEAALADPAPPPKPSLEDGFGWLEST